MCVRWIKYFVLIISLIVVSSCKDDKVIDEILTTQEEFYDSPFSKMPDLNEVVMYQANQRVFAQKESFKAITARLDNIKELGVNVLWLMPINSQGKEKAFGSPYAVQDYKKLEPEYGTMSDLRELVKEAHNRDIAVIVDWVANHTAWDNPWLKKNSEWFTKHANGEVGPPEGTNWNDVVDLNFDNYEMRKAMIDAMKYWIREANIDGYRCDAADWVPADFWLDAIYELRKMEEGREVMMLAEGTDPENLKMGFDIDYAWNFGDVLEELFQGKKSVANLIQAHYNEFERIPAGKQKLRHNTNHDRAFEKSPLQNFTNKDGALASFVISTTMGGVPLIYSSQEVAYDKAVNFFNYVNVNWSQNQDFYQNFKDIMKAYTSTDIFRTGELETFSHKDVLAYTYSGDNGQQVAVIVNVRNKTIDYDFPDELKATSWNSLITGEQILFDESIELTPYEYIIVSK